MTTHHTNHNPDSQWDALIRRYFEAETTPDEERRLRTFLASPAASSSRYDEVRAVTSYLAVGRNLHAAPFVQGRFLSRRRALPRIAAAAAVVLLLGGAAAMLTTVNRADDCVAYVDGQRITNPKAVTAEMHRSMQAVVRPTDVPTVEHQLDAIFEGLPLK